MSDPNTAQHSIAGQRAHGEQLNSAGREPLSDSGRSMRSFIRSGATRLLRNCIKTAAAGLDLVGPTTSGITILIYHRVGAGNGGQMDLDPSVFDDQLEWLVNNADVISLDEAVDTLIGGESSAIDANDSGSVGVRHDRSRPTVVVTFDDGTTDWVDHVLPALTRHGIPATFYVATSFIDHGVEFPMEGVPLTWSALSELSSSDLVTIGSHTHRHMLLDRLDPTQIDDELDTSIELIGTHLGVTVEHFAYPKAVAGSAAAEAAVRKRFRSAALAGTRPNPTGITPTSTDVSSTGSPSVDLHRLSRSPVQASDTPVWFRRKARGGMRFEDDVRRVANQLRYRKLDS